MLPKDKIENLISVIKHLTKLLQQENELLIKPLDKLKLSQILEEKKTLTASYHHLLGIIENDNGLKDANPSLLANLTDVANTFQKLTDENCTKLLVKIEAAKRVFSVVQQAVRDQDLATNTYSQTGGIESSFRQAYKPALSVGVNGEY